MKLLTKSLAYIGVILTLVGQSAPSKAESERLARIEDRLLRLERPQEAAPDRLTLRGLLQVDGATYRHDKDKAVSERSLPLASGLSVRRARLEGRGTINEAIDYRLQIQFSDNEVSILNAFIGIDSVFGKFRIGNSKRPGSQEVLRSSSDLTFLERTMVSDAFDGGRALGLTMFHDLHDTVHLMSGVYSGDVGGGRSPEERSPLSYGARLSYNPWNHNDQGLVLSGFWLKQTSEDRPRKRGDLQTRVSRERILNTGRITDTKKYFTMGTDLSASYDRFRMIVQYQALRFLDRHPLNTGEELGEKLSGHLIEFGFMLTRDRRRFDQKLGLFEDVRPGLPFGEGGLGALELVVRHSGLDLNDGDIKGGVGDTLGLGLNWYPADRMGVIVEASRGRARQLDGLDDESISIFQGRVQVSF